MEPNIIYQDKDILVLDKPSGWVVNEAETTTGQPVVQKWLAKNFSHKAGSGSARKYPLAQDKEFRSGIVHRLDKETSGILLVAKTESAFKNLQAQFKGREVKKVYTALVHGKVEPKEGSVNAPVGRLSWNRRRFGIIPGGREAETRYRAISNFHPRSGRSFPISNEIFTLVELYPKTGRTHQIRIHLKYLGHPIVGDTFYAGRKTARADRIWCPRLFLHASQISFTHPKTGKKVAFEFELPQDLQTSLAKLEKV